MKIFKRTVDKQIKKWTDEECLMNFLKFFQRVSFSTQFIQDDDGIITHETLTMVCGDKVVVSAPQELDWPVKPIDVPSEFEVRTH